MKKKNTLLLLMLVTSIQLSFSQKLPSTLLWKISGNGLQNSSYLYGTMHLTDERIFNLGDSLYKAIEHSDGFAMEIDPEEFTTLIIDETKKNVYENSRPLKDIMSHSQFEKYGKMLAKKLNKNADQITTADVLREKNKWIQESLRTGKMETFLDTYLFDIARRQGKWTGGVEDLKDQEGLNDVIDESDIEQIAMDENLKKANNESLQYFINAYIKNDLNWIDSLSNLEDSVYEDALLFKRNKKMAMRMDSLARLRSMVFAVGAAHLPGDKGLIALLKEKGFTVTPVFSSKKIRPSDYKVAEVPLKWYDIKDEEGLYNASMPGKAGNVTLYGFMNMKMYFDIFSSTIYMTTALKTPYSQAMADSVLGVMASYYFGTSDYSKGKPITINNVPGREFISKKENYSHGYLLFKNGKMYIAVAICMKNDNSAMPVINQFLHSFSIPENSSHENKIITYTNKTKAFSIEVPAPPKSAADYLAATSKDSSIRNELNICSDPITGAYFFFGANEAAESYAVENDSVTLAAISESQKSKFKKMSIDTMQLKNGFRILDIGGMMAQAPLMMKAHYQFRGNRWYCLVAIYDTAKDKTSVERFFNSFTTLDYTDVTWNNFTSNDNIFSTWAPEKFRVKSDLPETTSEPMIKYDSYDSSRGDNYSVVSQNFSKYYWQNSDSALWSTLIKNYNTDSLLSKKPISNNGLKGYEILLKRNGSSNRKRVRMFLNGNKLFTLLTTQSAAEINNENNNKFFDSFRFNSIQPNSNLFVSKAALLLTDIASKDSNTRSSALKYLIVCPFTKKDLPLLHQAFLKNYPRDQDDYYDETKNNIRKIIIDLKDSSSFNFAKNNYSTADDSTRNILISIMASFPTKENYNDIKTLLLKQPLRIESGYVLSNSLSDSLKLTAEILPDLLPLLKDTVMAPLIINLSSKLLDSSLIHKTILQPYQSNILKLSEKEFAILKADTDNVKDFDYQLVDLIGKLNSPQSNSELEKWSLLHNSYLAFTALNSLLQNGQKINPIAVQKLANDKYTRIELYDSLNAYHKANLFPALFLNQKYFGESLVYGATEDDGPLGITYLSQKVMKFKGRKSRFYFYKVAFGDGEDTTYSLGAAGPFNINIKDISTKDATSSIYYDEDFDKSKMQSQITELIKKMENWFEWSDKKKLSE